MRFYSDIPNVIVMGGPKQVAHFANGEFETEDKGLIELLKKAGYPTDPVVEVEKPDEPMQVETDIEELTFAELKNMAKAHNVSVGHKNKMELIKALRAGD